MSTSSVLKSPAKVCNTPESLPSESSSINYNENVRSVVRLTEYLIDKLAEAAGINPSFREDFARAVEGVIDEARRRQAMAALPDKPVRDYLPGEGIINYLRSDEGFGPWLAAGALTRPLLREKSPKAYTALANWLRTNALPDDLRIPTLKEVNDELLTRGVFSEEMVFRAASARQRRLAR